MLMCIRENIIGIDHNTSNILDIDIAYIIENAIKKATKPIHSYPSYNSAKNFG